MDEIDLLLKRGVDNIYPSKSDLEKVLRSGIKLTVYQGFDPTGKKLHIGHMVGLMKLRQFQKLGHKIIFLIGDGTGQAGDPSGKLQKRSKFYNKTDLRANALKYKKQVSSLLDFNGDNPVILKYNSSWLEKLKFTDILRLLENFSLQQLIERDIFDKRIKNKETIGMREFLYPILQGYDSVALNIDLEVGGTDQTFNMLAGRHLVKNILNKEKFVMTLPILADSSGKKIGKTEGNIIALDENPDIFFGMIMKLPDDVIVKSLECLTEIPLTEINEISSKIKNGENPMIYKKLLANSILSLLYGKNTAYNAQSSFESTFQKKLTPTQYQTIRINKASQYNLVDIILLSKSVFSKSEAKRLIRSNAVELNNKIMKNYLIDDIKDNDMLKLGKYKFYKIKFK
jgi:tyrosyl-tRNA synthetase